MPNAQKNLIWKWYNLKMIFFYISLSVFSVTDRNFVPDFMREKSWALKFFQGTIRFVLIPSNDSSAVDINTRWSMRSNVFNDNLISRTLLLFSQDTELEFLKIRLHLCMRKIQS